MSPHTLIDPKTCARTCSAFVLPLRQLDEQMLTKGVGEDGAYGHGKEEKGSAAWTLPKYLTWPKAESGQTKGREGKHCLGDWKDDEGDAAHFLTLLLGFPWDFRRWGRC